MLDSRFYKQNIPGFACVGQLQLLLICHFADNPLYIYTVSAPLLYWFICFVTFRASLSGNVEVIEHLINKVNFSTN